MYITSITRALLRLVLCGLLGAAGLAQAASMNDCTRQSNQCSADCSQRVPAAGFPPELQACHRGCEVASRLCIHEVQHEQQSCRREVMKPCQAACLTAGGSPEQRGNCQRQCNEQGNACVAAKRAASRGRPDTSVSTAFAPPRAEGILRMSRPEAEQPPAGGIVGMATTVHRKDDNSAYWAPEATLQAQPSNGLENAAQRKAALEAMQQIKQGQCNLGEEAAPPFLRMVVAGYRQVDRELRGLTWSRQEPHLWVQLRGETLSACEGWLDLGALP